MRGADADKLGNLPRSRDYRAGHNRDATHHLPEVQRGATKQTRCLPERHVQTGRRGLALLALRLARRGVA